VDRVLGLEEPPRNSRPAKGSELDPFREAIAVLLEEDPRWRPG
jgi:hypothetical protein